MSKTEPANASTISQVAILQALKSTFLDLNLYRQAVWVRVDVALLHSFVRLLGY